MITTLTEILRRTFRSFSEDNCFRMAAALAYYSAFSLAPLLIVVMTVCGLVWQPADVRGRVEHEMMSVLGSSGAEQVKTMLEHATQPGKGVAATLVSIVALAFGATGVVGQLQAALNDAWGVQPDPKQGTIQTFFKKRLLSGGMILAVAFLLLISLMVNTVLTAMSDLLATWLPDRISIAVLRVANMVASLFITTLLFTLIFRVLPDAEIAWSDVTIGALLTAMLFGVGKWALGAYLGSGDVGTAFGAAGALALILLWVYYSALILLLGAEFTQAIAASRGHRVRPEKGAVRVMQKTVYES